MSMASISDSVSACLRQFRALSKSTEQADAEDTELPPDFSAHLVNNQLARFGVWSGNIGAHRKGRSSLDFRLRDASHIHAQVKQLLDDLLESLQDGQSRPVPSFQLGDVFS